MIVNRTCRIILRMIRFCLMATRVKTPTASEMAHIRWGKTTKEQRSAHGKKMVDAREAKRKRNISNGADTQVEAGTLTSPPDPTGVIEDLDSTDD